MTWQEALTPADRRELLTLHDGRAWLSIGIDWGLVFASFALVAYFPNPLTVLVAVAIIGARQLGFAIMRYGLMLRGVGTWNYVPRDGRVALEPMCALADEFFVQALATQPQAVSLWGNRVVARIHTKKNWMETFESGVTKGIHRNPAWRP